MSKPTQLWPGERMRKFFRAILRNDPQVDDELANRLSESLSKHINRMLVWNADPAGGSATQIVAPTSKESSKKDVIDDSVVNEAGAPWPDADTLNPPHLKSPAKKPRKKKKQPPPEKFDAYAFSAVVVLARSGQDALMRKLKKIKAPEHLRQLADAQHLGIPPSIVKADELRRAIIKGASQRLADRRAAAS